MAPAGEHALSDRRQVDLDLHGFVGVRLIGAEPHDVAKVVRQLGPIVATLHREPDITIRFVEDLEPEGPLTSVGRGVAAFNRRGLYLLRGKGGVVAKALLPLHDAGGCPEIVCERAMPSVPLLLAMVNFSALANGVLPLHASAFEHEGRGTVVCGWAKGGKTEVLLSFMARGARYIGDEWVYLAPGGAMFGVPEPIRLWLWQLRQMPDAWTRLRPSQRGRLRALDLATSNSGRAAELGGPMASLFRRASNLLQRQQWVQVPPADLFGAARIAPSGRVDDVLLTSIHDSPESLVNEISGTDVGRRMRASLRFERRPFDEVYDQFRFAFPDLSSPVVETAGEREAALLQELVPARAGWLRHPYPVAIPSLYQPVHAWVHR